MADMTAFITLKLKDQLTRPLNKVKGGLSALSTSQSGLNQSATKATGGMKKLAEAEKRIADASRQATAAMGEQQQQQNSLSKGMKQFAIGGALTLVANRSKAAISSSVNAIRGEQTAIGELATVGITNFDIMTKAGRKMQQDLGMNSEGFIAAAYDIKSGISSLSDEGVAAMTSAAAITAKATKGSTQQMTSFFASAYGMYKQFNSEMSDADFGNMFAASLAKSVQQFKTDGAAMQTAMQGAGLAIKDMHEQMAVLGMLQTTMDAGIAGTSLKAYAASAIKADDTLKKYGVRLIDKNKKLRDTADVMADMKKAFGDELDMEEKALIQKAFGTQEAVKMIEALYGQEEALRANKQALKEAKDEHYQMANISIDANKLGKWDLTGDNFNVLKKTLGDSFAPVLATIAPYIIDITQALTTFVENNQEIGAIIATIIVALTGIASVAGPVLMVLPGLSMFAKGLAIARTAMLGFNMTLLANPITWIIAGIAALAGGAYLIYKNWDGIKEWMAQFWANIRQKCADAFGFIKNLFNWSPVGLVVNNWGGVTNFLANPIEGAKALISSSIGGIKSLLNWSPMGLVVNNWDGITNALTNPVEAAQKLLNTAMGGIKGLFGNAPSLDEWAAQHEQSKAAIDGHLSQIKALTGARFDALDAIEKMTTAEKEQARQSAESAKLETALTKGNTLSAIEKQMRNKRNWGEGLNMLKDIENGGSATELQAALQAMSTVGENGQLKLDLKGTGLNEAEYQNLVMQVNELVALEEQAKAAQKALDRLDGKMDADINPPEPKPKGEGIKELPAPAPARPSDLEGEQVVSEITVSSAQAIEQAEGLEKSLQKLKTLKDEVQKAVNDAEGFLSKIDWSSHGLRMMQSLAQGIQTGGPIVRTAVAQQLAGLPNGGGATSNKGLYDGE